MTTSKRIAFFVADDTTWLLPACTAAIAALNRQHYVVNVTVFPDKLGKYTGIDVIKWYLRIFGIWTVGMLAVFTVLRRLRLLRGPVKSWKDLAHQFTLTVRHARNPNDTDVVNWVKANDIDIIYILFGYILKPAIIDAPRLGIINKHAALLPSCKGLYPYFWGIVHQQPLGVTLHQVDAGIDTGRILAQWRYPFSPEDPVLPHSMTHFYRRVFENYASDAVEALNKLCTQNFPEHDSTLIPAYYGLPDKADYQCFQKQGGRIITRWDLWYSVKQLLIPIRF